MRAWISVLLAAVLCLVSPAYARPAAAPVAGIVWPHTDSDLRPDPQARYGRLPNGLTYILYQNKALARGAEVRLRIASGSMQERDDQRGLAHFVEHMAFNGSTNIPEGDLSKILAHAGIAFGQDANAFTGYRTTTYILDLPDNTDELYDKALFILREIAGNLTLAPDAIDRERGVILGEERRAASAQYRADSAYDDFLWAGQPYPDRDPIGLIDTIRNAPRQALVDYYEDFYRPDNATLIIVGNFDIADMGKAVTDHFGDWKPARPGPLKTADFGTYQPKGPTAKVYAEAGLYESLSITWVRPWRFVPDSYADWKRAYVEDAVVWSLNQRLSRLGRTPDAPYISASLGTRESQLTGVTTVLSITPKPGRQKAALLAALGIVRSFIAQGPTRAEIAAYDKRIDESVHNMVIEAPTRESSDIAEGLDSSLDDDDVYMSAAQYQTVWKRIRPGLTDKALQRAIAVIFSGDGPHLMRQGEKESDFDAAALQAAYAEAQAATATAWTAPAAKKWSYTRFGKPVKFTGPVESNRLGYTTRTFPNHVRLNIQSTDNHKNEVYVSVRFGGGALLFSPDTSPLLKTTMLYDVTDGGLGKLTPDEVTQALRGRTVGIEYSLGDDYATLSGTTTTDSFATQMQLLMAYTVDPGYDRQVFDRTQAGLDYNYEEAKNYPRRMLYRGLDGFMTDNDPRYRFPTREEMKATPFEDLKALLRKTLTKVPIEITISGDIAEAAAVREVERTFATLPPVPEAVPVAPGARTLHLPQDHSVQVYTHRGRADQEVAYAAFPATDALTRVPTTRGLEVLEAVFDARLDDEFREQAGASYDAQAGLNLSEVFDGYGYMWMQATINPDQDQAFYDAVTRIALDLQTHPVSDDELDRARKPLIEAQNEYYKSNTRWDAVISGLHSDSRRWIYNVDVATQYEKVTPDTLLKLAQLYLRPEAMLRAKSVPEAKPE